MARTVLLFFLFFTCYTFAQIQEFKGKCFDKNNTSLQGVIVGCSSCNEEYISNEYGEYTIKTPQTDTLVLRFKFNNETKVFKYSLSSISSNALPDVAFNVQVKNQINLNQNVRDPFEIDFLKPLDYRKITSSVEKSLVFSTPAVSNNELTSNYNVRGGNFDENLIYVNGFLIYRPFLTRSGQQEGMSFIHSSLVNSIQFSAGGFQSKYGDRLSSVLDIQYKSPDSLEGSITASLLSTELFLGQRLNHRFNYILGARYRTNGYLLNALPTQGAYNPLFSDAQFMSTYFLNEKTELLCLGHVSLNNFRFQPQTQETDFGVANEAYTFKVYFEGQEQTKFQNAFGGLALKHKANNHLQLDFYSSIFYSDEKEYFDVLGQYYINQLETDPSKEEYGDSIAVLGVGSFLNHGRNKLNAYILNLYHDGSYGFDPVVKNEKIIKNAWLWGINYQRDLFSDTLSEWRYIDSAGYSLPQNNPDLVELVEVIKNSARVQGNRLTGYVQFNHEKSLLAKKFPINLKYKEVVGNTLIKRTKLDTINESAARIAISLGTRFGYTQVNDEFYVTPRFIVSYFPRKYMMMNNKVVRRNVRYHFSTGLYYQPPLYREYRYFDGTLNLNVQSQKSLHAILGADYFFQLWGRNTPFKFSAETYYKYLWNINPYEIDNVRTRYYANNDAIGYAYGVDAHINGEFVKGIESFFKIGLMSVKENLLNDSVRYYYNDNGERILFGYSEDQVVVDSTTIYPGFIPRPTDQWLNVGTLIQDNMPGLEEFSVQMGLQYGARLPYGPPDRERYRDTLRLKSYFRVDIGFSYDFMKSTKKKTVFSKKNLREAAISLEIFNLLGIRNVLSKQWIQDVNGTFFSVPNYLTNRRVNLKLILGF